MTSRISSTLRAALWLGWLAVAAFITTPFFIWQVRYFHSPGSQFYSLLLVLLPLFFAALPVWLWIRSRLNLWRYEPLAVASFLFAAFLFYRFTASLATLFVILSCYAFGRWISERLKLEIGPPSADIPMSIAFGFAAFGPPLFLLGLAHLYYAWVFAILFAAPCILFWRHLRDLFLALRSLHQHWRASEELRDPIAGLAVVFGAIAAGVAAVLILVPSIAFDPIHTHLLQALFYSTTHVLAPVPRVDYSYFPQGCEALMTVGFALAGQPAAQMMPAIFFGLAALLGLRLVRETGASAPGAIAGVAAAVTVPVLQWTGAVAKNDLMMTFFELAALECFLAWRRTANFRWIPCAAVLLATAFDVKHVALFGAIPLAAFFAYAIWKQPRRLRAALVVAAAFVVFGLYWHVRTFVLTGNPLYPESLHRGATTMHRSHGAPLPAFTRNPVMRYARIAWMNQFHGRSLFESPLAAPVGILLFVCWPAWLLTPRHKWRAPEIILLLFAGAYLAYWGATFPILRYALPPVFILFLLTGSRLAEFAASVPLVIRLSAQTAFAYSLTFALLGIAIIGINAPQLRLLAHRIDDAEYLHEAMITTDAMRFLGRVASPGDHAVCVNIGEDLYSPRFVDIQSFFRAGRGMPSNYQQALRESDYQWMVAMRGDLPSILDITAGVKKLTPVWHDSNFTIFRVSSGKI
jgi:hypothetical protein